MLIIPSSLCRRQVVAEHRGTEEYVHLKSLTDEYEFMDSTMPPKTSATAAAPNEQHAQQPDAHDHEHQPQTHTDDHHRHQHQHRYHGHAKEESSGFSPKSNPDIYGTSPGASSSPPNCARYKFDPEYVDPSTGLPHGFHPHHGDVDDHGHHADAYEEDHDEYYQTHKSRSRYKAKTTEASASATASASQMHMDDGDEDGDENEVTMMARAAAAEAAGHEADMNMLRTTMSGGSCVLFPEGDDVDDANDDDGEGLPAMMRRCTAQSSGTQSSEQDATAGLPREHEVQDDDEDDIATSKQFHWKKSGSTSWHMMVPDAEDDHGHHDHGDGDDDRDDRLRMLFTPRDSMEQTVTIITSPPKWTDID